MSLLQNLLHRLRTPASSERDDSERAAGYPPPYPDGWYKLADSNQLPNGGSRLVRAFDQRLALFRGQDGQVGLLDAICPHQGANLADGKVRDGCLECPFHHWRFACDGHVEAMPYATSKPALRARTWPVREYHGMIIGYYSAARARGEEVVPPYELEPLPPMKNMVARGRLNHPRPVRMHLIEFAENSADFQHFKPLHGRMQIPWTPWRVPLVTVHHSPNWEIDRDKPYICYFQNDAVLQLAGRALPSTSARASITFLGPGGLTVFRIQIPKLGDVLLFHTHLPTGPLELDVQFRWYADPAVPRLLVSYVVGSWIAQWRNDIAVWENKYYKPKPMLVPGDGPVLQLRRWFKQFYPEAQDVQSLRRPRSADQRQVWTSDA